MFVRCWTKKGRKRNPALAQVWLKCSRWALKDTLSGAALHLLQPSLTAFILFSFCRGDADNFKYQRRCIKSIMKASSKTFSFLLLWCLWATSLTPTFLLSGILQGQPGILVRPHRSEWCCPTACHSPGGIISQLELEDEEAAALVTAAVRGLLTQTLSQCLNVSLLLLTR